MTSRVSLKGMHGLGDNIRSRAIVREFLARGCQVLLSTPWPAVFEDLVATNQVTLIRSHSPLRTQAKNEARQDAAYTRMPLNFHPALRLWYPPSEIKRAGSILGAMYAGVGLPPDAVARADFTLPVPMAWVEQARAQLPDELWNEKRPLLIYRPLVSRTEWNGCSARNPDFDAYAELYERVRPYFCTISIADLEPGREWLVGHPFVADYCFHNGELPFETLAALYLGADLVFCSPGFSAVLAQAVNTPYVLIFGGYENSKIWPYGLHLPPHLHVDTISPCECFAHYHACEKRIDVDAATKRLDTFVGQVLGFRGQSDVAAA